MSWSRARRCAKSAGMVVIWSGITAKITHVPLSCMISVGACVSGRVAAEAALGPTGHGIYEELRTLVEKKDQTSADIARITELNGTQLAYYTKVYERAHS